MPKLAQRTVGTIFLLINVVAWGAALPIVKPALSFTTPFQFLLYRFFFAAVLALPILAYYLKTRPQLIKSIPKIIRIESLQTIIALALIYEGLARTTALEASLIVTALPFFVTLGGIIFLREKEEPHEWAGLLLALSGTIFLAVEPAINGSLFDGRISLLGNLLVIAYNFGMAAYLLAAKKAYRQLPKFFTTSISFWLGLAAFALLSMWKQQLGPGELLAVSLEQLKNPAVLFASLYMAVFGSIIGLTAYIIGQARMEASEASLFTYLEPLVYVPLAVFFLQEPVTPGVIVAMVLIAAGVLVAEIRWRTKR